MKLLRWGPKGSEKPGLIESDGTIRDLSGHIEDVGGSALSAASIRRLKSIDASSLPTVEPGTRIGACVGHVGNFVAVGLNYADHAKETNAPIPAEPILFNKAPSCIAGPNDGIVIPRGSTRTDWEVELAIVIGEPALYVSEPDARDVIAGFCVCNDVSERHFQIDRGGQWMKGKSAPSFGPLGPWLVTRDEVPDFGNLALWLDVNGERMQTGSTRTMIFGVPRLVSYISQFMRLEPGDVITTGTPPGVGLGQTPPRFLKPGDQVTLGVEGLGEQRQIVEACDVP